MTETESGKKPAVSDEAKAMEAKLSTSKSGPTYVFHNELHDAMKTKSAEVSGAVLSVKGLGSTSEAGSRRFFAFTGGSKDKDLSTVLKTSADKSLFSKIMANANKILTNIE